MSLDEMSFEIKCQICNGILICISFLQIWILLVKNLTLSVVQKKTMMAKFATTFPHTWSYRTNFAKCNFQLNRDGGQFSVVMGCIKNFFLRNIFRHNMGIFLKEDNIEMIPALIQVFFEKKNFSTYVCSGIAFSGLGK